MKWTQFNFILQTIYQRKILEFIQLDVNFKYEILSKMLWLLHGLGSSTNNLYDKWLSKSFAREITISKSITFMKPFYKYNRLTWFTCFWILGFFWQQIFWWSFLLEFTKVYLGSKLYYNERKAFRVKYAM